MYKIKNNYDLAINSEILLNTHPDAFEKVLKEQDVDPSEFEDTMRLIREWYQKEPHLPEGQLCDQRIAKFLLLMKFSTEKVKKGIDSYFSVRPKMEFLCNRDPLDPNLNKYLKTGYWIILPRMTPNNCRVTIFRTKTSEGVCLVDIIKVLCIMIDYRIWNDTSIAEEIIFDYSNITFQLASQMTPVLATKIVYYISRCLGARLNGIHIINMPPVCEMLLPLFKKIMKPKVFARMNFYKTFDDVVRRFPKNMFPKELGGTEDITCQEITDNWEKTLCSPAWRQFLIEQSSIHADELKRIIRHNFEDDFGLDGSFKKLNID